MLAEELNLSKSFVFGIEYPAGRFNVPDTELCCGVTESCAGVKVTFDAPPLFKVKLISPYLLKSEICPAVNVYVNTIILPVILAPVGHLTFKFAVIEGELISLDV